MSVFHTIYIICWSIAFLIAIGILLFRFNDFELSKTAYWCFLFQPWKIITFLIAGTGLVFIAPYTGDVTWDYYDASIMAILTFLTAPWAIGLLYKVIHRERPIWQSYVAICLWLFSASWCYDLYLILRDGYYPNTWLANIFASSVLYVSAGFLWSLEYKKGRGVIFAFMDKDWPNLANATSFKRVILFASPFMLIATVAILSFVF